MIAWLLTFTPVRASLTPVIGDFSRVQPSKQRARGRIGSTVVNVDEAEITTVRTVSVKKGGRLRSMQLYRLTLKSEVDSRFHIFFAANDASELRALRWKRAPRDATSYSQGLPMEITSVQYASPKAVSPIYSAKFSINLSLSQISPGKYRGSVLLVFPDHNLSFVNGAFRANLL